MREAWEEIRKVVFNIVLKKNTMPIELRNIYGIGYFNIMVKPILNLYNHEYYQKDENEGEKLFSWLCNVGSVRW